MICFKGFDSNLTATFGKGNMRFEPNKTYIEENSKTVRTGFHCAEYPMHCLRFYPLRKGNRYFKVEAAGDIDDDEQMVACTRLTLKKELTLKEMIQYTLFYIMSHPQRDLEHSSNNAEVHRNEAETTAPGEGLAIAFGKNPKVRAKDGNFIGLIRFVGKECVGGLWQVGKIKPENPSEVVKETWYTVDDVGNLIEVKE